MACEPLGVNYLSKKPSMLKDIIWPLVNNKPQRGFEKLAIAVFQKFSLKKRFCIQMMHFGIVEWLLKVLVNLKPSRQ